MAPKKSNTKKVKIGKTQSKKVEIPKAKPEVGKTDLVPSKPKKIPPIPACFGSEDVEKLTELYNLHDSEKTGMVPIRELPLILRQLGFNPKPQEIYKILDTILEDDLVDTFKLHEWFSMVEMKLAMPDDKEFNVVEAMAILGSDEEDTGVIDLEILRQELSVWGEPLLEIEFVDWIKIAKKDKTFNSEEKTFHYKKFIENLNEKDTKFVKEPVNYFKLDQQQLAELAFQKVEKEKKDLEKKEMEKLAREEAKRQRMIEKGLLLLEDTVSDWK